MASSLSSTELIRALVGFDTVSSKSNLALIDFVRDYLAGHGVESRYIRSEDATKANLWATIGPDAFKGVAQGREVLSPCEIDKSTRCPRSPRVVMRPGNGGVRGHLESAHIGLLRRSLNLRNLRWHNTGPSAVYFAV